MKRILSRLILTVCALLCPTLAFAQAGNFQTILLSGSGQPLPGVNVAVCSTGLTTTAASVTNNIATLTMSSNPITAGFLGAKRLTVSSFTGGDTYFNGTYTIAAVGATTISYALTHANASAASNGKAFQTGDAITSCAPVASLFTDDTAAVAAANPTTSDSIGNVSVWAASGVPYQIQYYGANVVTKVVEMSVGLTTTTILAANNAFTGNNTHSGTETFTGVTSITNAGAFGDAAMDEYFKSNINACNTQTEFQTYFSGSLYNTAAVTGCVNVPSSGTKFQGTAIQGYGVGGSANNAVVAVSGLARAIIANAHVFGFNSVAQDCSVAECGIGIASVNVHGYEADLNLRTSGSTGDSILCGGIFNTGTTSFCLNIGAPIAGTNPFWTYGIRFQQGATQAPTSNNAAIYFSPVAAGVNQQSQGLEFVANDPASGQNFGNMVLTPAGNLLFSTSKAGTGINGNAFNLAFVRSGGAFGFPDITGNGAAKVIIGDSNGVGLTGPILFTGSFAPNVAGASDLCTALLPCGNLWIGTAATNNVKVTATATAARIHILPDATGTLLISGNGDGTHAIKNQSVRFSGVLGGTCPTAAAIGAACTSGNINWTTSFGDNSYAVVCTLNGSLTGQPHIVGTAYQAGGVGITITIAADTAAAANVAAAGFTHCIAIHD